MSSAELFCLWKSGQQPAIVQTSAHFLLCAAHNIQIWHSFLDSPTPPPAPNQEVLEKHHVLLTIKGIRLILYMVAANVFDFPVFAY